MQRLLGSEVARRVFGGLLERHARALVVSNYGFILEELHKRLEIERDRLPRDVFTGLLETGEMRFIVAAEDLGFNRLALLRCGPKGAVREYRMR